MIGISTFWIVIVCYFSAIFGLSQIYQRITSKNREKSLLRASLPFPILLFTYLASLMSTWVFFGGPGSYYRGGLGQFLAEVSGYLMFGLVAHFFANRVWLVARKRTYVTPSDFYKERYNSPALSLIVAIIMLIGAVPYIISILYAITTAGTIATGGVVSYRAMLVAIGILMILFTSTGFKSVAVLDAFQGIFYIAVVFIIGISLLNKVYGGSLTTAVSSVWKESNNWFSYPGPNGQTPYSMRFAFPVATTIGATFMLPHTFVRATYSGDSMKTQRQLGMAMPIMQVIVWGGCCLIGMIALAKLPNLAPSETEFAIPFMIEKFIFSDNPFFAQVLMMLFVLGAIAVGLSTTNAFLLVSSSIIYEDILVKVLHIKADDAKERVIVRVILVALGAFTIILAMDPPSLIFTLVTFAMGIVMPLFPICLFGIYWKKATRPAAVISAVVGTVINILSYTTFGLGDNWSGTWGMVASLILMYVISSATQHTPSDQASVDNFFDTMEASAHEVYEELPEA